MVRHIRMSTVTERRSLPAASHLHLVAELLFHGVQLACHPRAAQQQGTAGEEREERGAHRNQSRLPRGYLPVEEVPLEVPAANTSGSEQRQLSSSAAQAHTPAAPCQQICRVPFGAQWLLPCAARAAAGRTEEGGRVAVGLVAAVVAAVVAAAAAVATVTVAVEAAMEAREGKQAAAKGMSAPSRGVMPMATAEAEAEAEAMESVAEVKVLVRVGMVGRAAAEAAAAAARGGGRAGPLTRLPRRKAAGRLPRRACQRQRNGSVVSVALELLG